MSILSRDLEKFPPRFKVGEYVHYVTVKDDYGDAHIEEVVSANNQYEAETIEDHIKCDTYLISFYVFGNRRERWVSDEALLSDEEYQTYKEESGREEP